MSDEVSIAVIFVEQRVACGTVGVVGAESDEYVNVSVTVEVVAPHRRVGSKVVNQRCFLKFTSSTINERLNYTLLAAIYHIVGNAIIVKVAHTHCSAHGRNHIFPLGSAIVYSPGGRLNQVGLPITIEVDCHVGQR